MKVRLVPVVLQNKPGPKGLASPNIAFVKEQCYWPENIGLTDKFTSKFVIQNTGDADADVFLALTYKGKHYLFSWEAGGVTVPLAAGSMGTATMTDITIQEILTNIEVITETTTLEFLFVTGYAIGTGEAQQFWSQDSWSVRTYVKVAGVLPVPTSYLLVAALGLVGVGGGVYLLKKRKKK